MNRSMICTLASALAITATAPAQSAVFFSEYVEGSSNNKALEIYNGTGGILDLGAGSYFVEIYSNGASTPSSTIALTGSVAPGGVFVLANNAASPLILSNQQSASVTFNGNDAVVLRSGSTRLDVFGQIGNDPGQFGWGTVPHRTTDNTLRRMEWVIAGDTNGADLFNPSLQWTAHGLDQFGGLGFHTAAIPEPETYALLLAGLGLLGFAMRRRVS